MAYSSPATPEQEYALDLIFRKMLDMTGIRQDLFTDWSFGAQFGSEAVEASDATALYVDGAKGNDANDGSSVKPLRTIQAAFDRLPKLIDRNMTINIAPGTYTENLTLDVAVRGTGAMLLIKSTGWTTYTPAAGLASGTIASTTSSDGGYPISTFGGYLNVTGAGWTVDEMKGKFVGSTAAFASSRGYMPIFRNTATAIEVPHEYEQSAGFSTYWSTKPFSFVTPGVVINPTGDTRATLLVLARSANSPSSNTEASFGVVFSGLRINGTTNTSPVRVYNAAGVTFEYCHLDFPAATQATISQGFVTLRHCYVSGDPSGGVNASRISVFNGSYDMYYCCVDGVYHLTSSTNSGSFLGFNGCMIRNTGNYGIYITRDTAVRIYSTHILGCSVGLYQPQGLGIWAGHCNIYAHAFHINGCSSHGIELGGSYNVIHLRHTSDISGNGGWGIKLGDGTIRMASFNDLHLYATSYITFSGNTSGDITLDGTTNVTSADVTAAPDKTILHATRLNRVAKQD